MSTSVVLILAAQDNVIPSDVLHPGFRMSLHGVIVLNGVFLRRLVEQRCNTGLEMKWEDWLDVRVRWCSRYRAHGVEIVKGHTTELPALASLASLRGYHYLLLEEVA